MCVSRLPFKVTITAVITKIVSEVVATTTVHTVIRLLCLIKFSLRQFEKTGIGKLVTTATIAISQTIIIVQKEITSLFNKFMASITVLLSMV